MSGSIVGNAVWLGTMISSPGPTPCNWCNRYTIIVHEVPRTQWAAPVCAASSASKAWHSLPRIYCPDRSARNAASSISELTKHFDSGILCINVSAAKERKDRKKKPDYARFAFCRGNHDQLFTSTVRAVFADSVAASNTRTES